MVQSLPTHATTCGVPLAEASRTGPGTTAHKQGRVAAENALGLSYTPPLRSPWEAVQMGTQAWVRDTQRPQPARI
jgi:hypothetical protein